MRYMLIMQVEPEAAAKAPQELDMEQVIAAMQGAQVVSQGAKLLTIGNIAAEKDVACGLHVGKERALIRG